MPAKVEGAYYIINNQKYFKEPGMSDEEFFTKHFGGAGKVVNIGGPQLVTKNVVEQNFNAENQLIGNQPPPANPIMASNPPLMLPSMIPGEIVPAQPPTSYQQPEMVKNDNILQISQNNAEMVKNEKTENKEGGFFD